MRLRLSSLDEFQLLTCFKHGLWGAQTARFGDWQQGDYLLLMVKKRLAALAQITGKPYKDVKKKIWDNNLYPHRIPIKFLTVLNSEDRPPLLGEIRDELTSAWGPSYGWGILNQQLVEGKAADKLISAIKSSPNNAEKIEQDLTHRLEAAAALRIEESTKTKKQTLKPPDQLNPKLVVEALVGSELDPTPQEATAHHKTQDILKRLGKLTGCSVWIASNDKNKQCNGKALSDGTLPALPSLGLSEDAVSRISLIDVIWISQGAPICAFEVETTTSIYSGLLRMSDLLAVVPALKLQLFIVAPKDRQDKFFAQLNRPTFRKIGLSDYWRFISIEELEMLAKKIADLKGIQPSVLDNIAVQLDEEISS